MNLPFRRSIRGVAIGCATAALFAAGCDGAGSPDSSAPSSASNAANDAAPHVPEPAPTPPPLELPSPTPPPIELTSPEQALDELIAAVDDRRSRDYLAAGAYLQSRGPEVVPLIEARMAAGDLSPAAQIALVRQLGSAGEPALPVLETLTSSDRSQLVRVNAIEQIGRVRPVTTRATDFLRSILREGEPRDRMESLEALDRMGANSNEFVGDLRAILESDAPEELRRKAKESLDRAKPRRTFEDRD